jgi:ADP-L-glycero-D-manno-heptose 6-epimerase
MVYASSAATYGSLPSPQTVGIENPENPYGYSKYLMDQIAYRYSNENPGMAVVGLKFFNVYGSREYYKAKTSSLVIQLGHQILDGKAPKLFEGSDKIFRDFINIEDVIQANIKACHPKKNGVYNIGTGNPRSFQDIADILQAEFGTTLGNHYISNPYDDYQMHTQADIRSSKENLGFEPIISLEQGIKKYIPEIKRFHGTSYS